MAIKRPDIYEHNNVNLAISDTDSHRGGFRSAVASVNDLYALSGKTGYPSAPGQLKEYSTIVYVSGETKYYVLTDINNVGNASGWSEFQTGGGGGTLDSAENGLSLIDSGTTVVLGGTLLSATTINASGQTFYLTNVDDFQVSTTGSTLFGLDNTGFLLTVSGASLTFDDNQGLIYGGDYSTNYVDRSLVDKAYVNAIAAGLQPKMAVLVATTGNTSLSGLSTIDGIVLQDNDRVLVKNQTSGATNGIYVASASTWTRANDFDGTPEGEIAQGALIPVISGNSNHNTLWVLVTPDPISGGTTPLTFTLFSKVTDLHAGIGINISGDTINVDGNSLAGNYIVWSGNTFNVNNNAITSGYTTLTQFNDYTGDTETRLTGIENDIQYISGVTDTKLDTNIFTGYTASTETRLTGIEGDIQYISGQTLSISVFTGYTASTEIRLTGIENDISYISGVTDTKLNINTFTGYTATTSQAITNIENDILYISGVTSGLTTSKLDVSTFNSYTGTTQPILDFAITGATNGLNFSNRNIKLGGDLIENTVINLSTFDFNISGDSLQYSADYSAGYNARSIPDVDYVSGYTQSAVTQNSNVIDICIVYANYSATTTNDFIGVSGNTSYCIWLPPIPKTGQRISVSDICVGALTYPICIIGTGGRCINGSSIATINTDYGSITFINNGNSWSAVSFIN
jgi:hypothetical protein